MILLCCHWCPDGSARVSLVEYSSSLRTCSPRYLIIQYLNNPKKSPPKVFFFVFFLTAVTWGLALLDTRLFNTRIIKQKLLFSYSSSLRTCSPRYTIPIFCCWYWAEVALTVWLCKVSPQYHKSQFMKLSSCLFLGTYLFWMAVWYWAEVALTV